MSTAPRSSATRSTLFPKGSSPTLTVNGTAFNVSNAGLLSFVSGQTFPGTGTITGVTTANGSGLTGGGTSGNLNLALTNICAANQVLQWNGSGWVCSNAGTGTITGVFGGTDLTGQGTSGNVTLNLDITKVPQLGTPNIFGGTQTVGSGDLAINVGNLDLPQTGGGNVGVITLGGAAFIHACCANSAGNTSIGIQAGAMNGGSQNNTATGYQALGNTVGTSNTGSGYQALASDGQGNSNTAVGYQALYQNTSGSLNTAVGKKAGYTNTTAGSNNTFVGASADVGSDGLTNATAIGANAQVTTNNALVLGSIAGVNNATTSANVGIGTTAPASTLDVHGTGNFTGLITFAPNQTFPGAGTITGVNTPAGSGLTGGGTSGTLNLGLTNTCSSGQVLTWSGSTWVCTGLSGGGTITGVTHGTYLTGGGTSGNVTLDLDTTKVPLLDTANTFYNTQTVNATTIGVIGNVTDGNGGQFYNDSPRFSALYAENYNVNGAIFGAFNPDGYGCTIDGQGNLNCTGAKHAIVPLDGGKRKVALSAIESPENWFEDLGSARLVNGVAVVQLDPDFIQTVNTDREYNVFLTPYGDCKGLYVTNRAESSFEVHELSGGTSNVSFGYRITAIRRKYEMVRFEDHSKDLDPAKILKKIH
jgi:hypothetical protein